MLFPDFVATLKNGFFKFCYQQMFLNFKIQENEPRSFQHFPT